MFRVTYLFSIPALVRRVSGGLLSLFRRTGGGWGQVLLLTAFAAVAAGDQAPQLTLQGLSHEVVYTVTGGKGHVSFSLSLPETGRVDGRVYQGFRLYRQKQGSEISFKQPAIVLEEDLQRKTECTVGGLQNGELYVFYLRAYDRDDKEFWEAAILGLPGIPSSGNPRTPEDCYGIAGDGRAALYWEKNLEAGLRGYEVFRREEGEADYRLIARIPKLFRIKLKRPESTTSTADTFFHGLATPGYVDERVVNGRTYRYRVRAFDAEGRSSSDTETIAVTPHPAAAPSPDEVLLIVNEAFEGSEEVAQYYAKKRKIPADRIFRFRHDPAVYAFDYQREIQYPLQRFLLKHRLAGRIRYLVPCYGVPIRAAGRAFDSKLTDLFDRYTYGLSMGSPNPYFNSRRHFDGTTGTYLVTRLDGPTVEVAKGLVDKALMAEQQVTARSGKAYFGSRGRNSPGDKGIGQAVEIARKGGVPVVARTGEFGEHELGDDAFWYFAWYHAYRDPVKGMWPTGAVGAHLISSSFYEIRGTGTGTRSWVQGLLEKGITATFGAVIEPYETGYTRPDIFFEQFWSGDYTFAESFAMATPTVQWAMSAVGDPLYRLRK